MTARSQDDIGEFIEQVCLAAEQGDLAKIRDLAERGPGLNVVTSYGDPLLSKVLQNIDVAQEYRFDVVPLLLDLGAEANILCADEGTSSLMERYCTWILPCSRYCLIEALIRTMAAASFQRKPSTTGRFSTT